MESSSETAARRSRGTKKKLPFNRGQTGFTAHFTECRLQFHEPRCWGEAWRRPALASVRFLLNRPLPGGADESRSLPKEARLIEGPCPARCSVAASHLQTSSLAPTEAPCATGAASQDPNNNSHDNNDGNNNRTDTVGAA